MKEMISISEVRGWANEVLDAVEAAGVYEIAFEPHLYWQLETDEVWSADAVPELTVGDSADDVAGIRRDLTYSIEERSQCPEHTLDHFIGVLVRLSATLKSYDLIELRKAD